MYYFLIDFFIKFFTSLGQYGKLIADALKKSFSQPYYRDEIIKQMDYIGVSSLPIIILTGFFSGMVLALESAYSFEAFGVKAYIGKGVAIAQVRELGPVIGALMVNGRVGAGIAAELGSMVVGEQIEALRAIGVDPVRRLVVPRIIAGFFMLPVLIIIGDYMGIFGGYIICTMLLKFSGVFYWSSVINALKWRDFIVGLSKPFVFGLIITTIACYKGMFTKGGTVGVGRSTTDAVVIGSVIVLFADFLLTKLFVWLF